MTQEIIISPKPAAEPPRPRPGAKTRLRLEAIEARLSVLERRSARERRGPKRSGAAPAL